MGGVRDDLPVRLCGGEERDGLRRPVGDLAVMAEGDTVAGWRWDVALSFAGAQREYVEQVAAALKTSGVRCFYDADEEIGLWGTHLAEELPTIEDPVAGDAH
jgi:hypothetical protein